MSGRLLRQVLKEQEQNNKQEGIRSTEELQESIEDDEFESDARPINPFDLLNDDEVDLEDQVLFCTTFLPFVRAEKFFYGASVQSSFHKCIFYLSSFAYEICLWFSLLHKVARIPLLLLDLFES